MTSDFDNRPEDFAAQPDPQNQSQGQTEAQPPVPANNALADDLKYAPKKSFVAFNGYGAELFGIMIVNFIFTILTLGIYHFWGKVKVRKYLWSHSNVLGSPLEYTGNGLELFTSFLIVFICLTIYSMVVSAVPLLALLAAPVMLWAIYFAMYRSLRFRLTRTRWRGIYANLGGSAAFFANKVIFMSIANVLCLGFLTPYITTRLYSLVLNNVYWGDMKFSFAGEARPLYKSFFIGMGVSIAAISLLFVFGHGYFMLVATAANHGETYGVAHVINMIMLYLATVLAISLGFLYYAACKMQWLYNNLSLPGARFTCGLPISAFIFLYLTNALLLMFTLGFGYAWVVVRTINCLTAAAVYQGELDIDAMQQNTQAIPKRGDGLLDALDLDVAF